MKKLLCVLLALLLVLSVNAGYADKKTTDTVFIGEFTRLTLKRYLSMTANIKISATEDMSFNALGDYASNAGGSHYSVSGKGYMAILSPEDLTIQYISLDFLRFDGGDAEFSQSQEKYITAMISALECTDFKDNLAKTADSYGLKIGMGAEDVALDIVENIANYLEIESNVLALLTEEQYYVCSGNYDYYVHYLEKLDSLSIVAKAR